MEDVPSEDPLSRGAAAREMALIIPGHVNGDNSLGSRREGAEVIGDHKTEVCSPTTLLLELTFPRFMHPPGTPNHIYLQPVQKTQKSVSGMSVLVRRYDFTGHMSIQILHPTSLASIGAQKVPYSRLEAWICFCESGKGPVPCISTRTPTLSPRM